ncbi:MAG: DUF2505 domain-containing protein [Pseudomonadota bacterium]
MKAGFSQDYPATPDRLWQVFGQADYPHRKYQAQGITAYRVLQFDAAPDRISLDLERTLSVPLDRIPHFAQRFVHPEQTLHYLSSWRRQGQDQADFDLQIVVPGLPLHITGKGQLRPVGAGSRLSIEFDVRVSLPLIGGKIEKMIAAFIEKSFQDDQEFTLRYLAEAG